MRPVRGSERERVEEPGVSEPPIERRGSPVVAWGNWLVDRTSRYLGRNTSRRGFLVRSALAGSAVAVAGVKYTTRPVSAYTLITDCPPDALCRDGYTEFCCVIQDGGYNRCPPGTLPMGWWRADYSVFCNGTRYYLDCNEVCCGPPRGYQTFCNGCHPCGCALDCNSRKTNCTYFRYGQCNQQIEWIGPITCRMVTCVPPYTMPELNCAPDDAVDNSTANHTTACLEYVPPPPPPPPPPPLTSAAVQRLHGPDAIDTCLVVSRASVASGAAGAVVLARSDHFSDALAGGPLAAALGGPLLITPGGPNVSALDPRVTTEIRRVLPAGRTVYVLGGPIALAAGMDAELVALGYDVVRVQGANEYSTATAVAERLGHPPVVFLATARHFADALSAVPAAIRTSGAILLTDGPRPAPETTAYLSAHPPATRYAIGGPLAAAGADPGAVAVYGQDLYATSAAVASTFFPAPRSFGAATGTHFSDALCGGVFMGAPERSGPVLLVDPAPPVPAPVADYLRAHSGLGTAFLFGGPQAVSDDVLRAIGHA
ncbi:MAG: hypothetical protein AMXMBFR46_17280 [Acidimicrobiia bacterium]